MNRIWRGASIGAMVLGISVVPHAVATSAQPPDGTPSSTAFVVAINGVGHQLWANRPGYATLHNLGGRLLGPPAVTAVNGQALFVADLKRGGLSIRTTGAGWRPLVKGGIACRQPEVTSIGKLLAVACLHHHAVYAARAKLPPAGLPTFKALHNQGGRFAVGPSVHFVTKQVVQVGEVGKPYNAAPSRNTYFHTLGTPKGFAADNQLACQGPQTDTSTDQYDELSIYGCVGHRHGHNGLVVDINDDSGFDPITTTGTAVVGRIGLAFNVTPAGSGTAYLAYTRKNHVTVVRTLTPYDESQFPESAVLATFRHAHGGAAVTSIAPPSP